DKLQAKLDDFCKQNMKASSDYCMALIQDSFHPLYEDVKQGTFSKPGGYYIFIKKMNELKDKEVPGKGVQTGETLRKYLDSKEGVADTLLQTDQSLTEKEKEIKVECMKSEAAEAAKKVLDEMQKNEQMMQEKEVSYQEHVRQLTEKMEKERAQLIADQERVLVLKLQVPMASGSTKMDPICLVENWKNQLSVNAKALNILEQISQRLVVVAVVGLYRTGKSYLMNRLAGQNHGNHTLVLLDTEGLGNVEKEDSKNDLWIFALAVLLSSTFIYNSMNSINHQTLQQLQNTVNILISKISLLLSPHFMSEMGTIMIMKEKDDFLLQNEEASVRYCQAELRKLSEPLATSISEGTFFVPGGHSLYLEARNKLEQDYKLVPRKGVKANQVLQSFLQSQAEIEAGILQADQALKDADKAMAEERTKRQAAEMKQDLLTQELNDKKQKLEAQERSHQENMAQLKEKFKTERENLLREQEAVLAHKLKLPMASGSTIMDPVCLVRNQNNQLTVNPRALKTLEQISQPVVVVAIAGLYRTGKSYLMNRLAGQNHGFRLGSTVRSETKGIWMWCVPHPSKENHTLVLLDTEGLGDVEKDIMEKKKDSFMIQNEEASVKYCEAELKQVSESLVKSISGGTFFVPGGHSLYLEARNKFEQDYKLVPRKGVKANQVLQSYLQSQAGVEEAILQADQALTAGDKAMAAECAKKDAAEREQELLREKQNEEEQKMEAQERSFKENLAQLQEKMERERENLLREQETMLEHKLKMQKELLTDGFKKEAEALDKEIDQLKEGIRTTKKSFNISDVLDMASLALVAVLPGPYKVVDIMVRLEDPFFKQSIFEGIQGGTCHGFPETLGQRDMASEIHMTGPECLIENTNRRLLVNPKALKILSAVRQPVVVVAIVGLYRTGKSYLMNKLAGKNKGFSLGSTVQSHTKGIWMWCVPHPEKPNRTLVLLDTEGLGDVEKGDNQNDSWIFALAILLSSTFVYNSMGTINQQAMDQLHYVTELTDRIRARSSPDVDEVEDSADFVSFFPDFVWTLRDFSLNLEADGQSITADEYLENSLKLRKGTSPKDKTFNMPRLCIRKFFPKKKCFIFDRPTDRKKLGQLEELCDDQLDPEFVQQAAVFCSYIFSNSKTKTLSGGIKVDGPRLGTLVQTYVNAINSGDLPCMENAVLALAEIENSAAVQKAIAHYDQQMGQKLQLPTETLQELLELHRATEKETIEVFMRSSFKDTDQLFQKELAAQLDKKRDDFCNQNRKASSDRCSALLKDIFSPLEEDVKQGIYSKSGGYRLFIEKMQELKKKYLQEPRKGTQADEILQEYLKSKESVTDAILQTDQTLSEKEKLIEVERMKAECAQAAAKMLEEMQIRNQQMMEQKEKSYQEHVKQLTEKMERERAQLLEEQERTLALKLQEQSRLLQEGFQEEQRRLQNEIQNLQKIMNKPSPSCVLS
ncbi:hypothetical protein MJG53_001828, partial [Ovis ammon polii x Ovis aries]